MTAPGSLSTALLLIVVAAACGGSPAPRRSIEPPVEEALGKRRADLPDVCAERPGKPPPEPLRASYTGLAKAARCQDEVFAIMGGVTHFLGVACKHCHQEPDYAADTHNKQVANWMARELVPRLRKQSSRSGVEREVWCKDCHAGKPKLLGNPRRRDLAIDWMTTHLSDTFDTIEDQPLYCRSCHGGDLGSPEFRTKIILSTLEGLPAPPAPSVPAPTEPGPGDP